MTIVDRYYQDFTALYSFLERTGEFSLVITVNEQFRKSLLLCAASYFERETTECVWHYSREVSSGNTLVPSLIRSKAIERQFHSWFDWDSSNANRFFKLFGNEFAATVAIEVKSDAELSVAIAAYLEIGRERNRLVHQDFGTYSLEKTAVEIYKLYQSAEIFVQRLPQIFRNWTPTTTA